MHRTRIRLGRCRKVGRTVLLLCEVSEGCLRYEARAVATASAHEQDFIFLGEGLRRAVYNYMLGLGLDEPIADSAILPTFLLSRFARESVKVALTGEGADELFAGHHASPR